MEAALASAGRCLDNVRKSLMMSPTGSRWWLTKPVECCPAQPLASLRGGEVCPNFWRWLPGDGEPGSCSLSAGWPWSSHWSSLEGGPAPRPLAKLEVTEIPGTIVVRKS